MIIREVIDMFYSKDMMLVLGQVYAAMNRDTPPSSYTGGKVTLEFKDGAVFATIQETFMVGSEEAPPAMVVSETNLPAS